MQAAYSHVIRESTLGLLYMIEIYNRNGEVVYKGNALTREGAEARARTVKKHMTHGYHAEKRRQSYTPGIYYCENQRCGRKFKSERAANEHYRKTKHNWYLRRG